ncbi:MAG TPA: hypothetical protein VGB04_04545 [Allosphingosinicella sp.]|jgi:hypothetical protein
MDRRPPGIDPASAEEEQTRPETEAAAEPDPLSEEELDRILPPIDENDPEWQAYEKRMIQEALADPRPPIPADEVRRRIAERHEAYLKPGI